MDAINSPRVLVIHPCQICFNPLSPSRRWSNMYNMDGALTTRVACIHYGAFWKKIGVKICIIHQNQAVVSLINVIRNYVFLM